MTASEIKLQKSEARARGAAFHIRCTNTLYRSPHYGKIMSQYAAQIKLGKVNEFKFWRECVQPLVPNYAYASFYRFVRRYKEQAGIVVAHVRQLTPASMDSEIVDNLVSSQVAEQHGIRLAQNLAMRALGDAIKNNRPVNPKDAAYILASMMKSKDSRVHAIAEMRQDRRAQDKFEQAFQGSAFEDDDDEKN